MAIYNLGSINLDYFYHVPHLPKPGETLASTAYHQGLGGKGANQSIAIARGGGQVKHIGLIHEKDSAHIQFMKDVGVDTTHIHSSSHPTGHAIVIIESHTAENQILLMQGANHEISEQMIETALATATEGDWALTQNETNLGDVFLQKAKAKGCQICYSAAPFIKDKLLSLIDIIDLLIVNEGEAEAVTQALGKEPDAWGIPHVIVTKGAEGAYYEGQEGSYFVPSEKVKAVDTTGAGDTYLGYILAQLSMKQTIKTAMIYAGKAAAIQVTRHGTADVIPALEEIKT